VHGGPAETYELKFYSDQDGPLPNRRERDLGAGGHQRGRDTGYAKRARLP
jgi:hypothetical protein